MAENTQPDATAAFRTTCWTDVLTAHSERPEALESFSRLYRDYQPPLYAYLRRRRFSHSEAEEIIQDFFVTLLEKDRLAKVRQEGGRFRSFLLTSLQNFTLNLYDRQQAVKRGGGAQTIPLEGNSSDLSLEIPQDALPPELIYDQEWARLVLKRALEELEREFSLRNKSHPFSVLRPLLQGDRSGRPYPELATELAMTESAVKVTVHRMRHRYGELLREEIARTVSSPAEVQDELRHLLRIVGT